MRKIASLILVFSMLLSLSTLAVDGVPTNGLSDNNGRTEEKQIAVQANADAVGKTFAEAFPDANFRAYVTGWVLRNSKEATEDISPITASQMATIENWDVINVDKKNISNLAGVEYFKAVGTLSCNNNQLTSLDVSQNVALKTLSCYGNQLENLNVSQNTALKELNCDDNELTSLDLSHNAMLTSLKLRNNQVTSLNVSYNTALVNLWCDRNKLTSLDVSHNVNLEALYCDYNQLTSLDISQNTALTWLQCCYNQLTNLDVSRNAALTYLRFNDNQVKSLDVSRNTSLEWLWFSNNQLTSIDVSHNTALTHLYCSNNQLTSIDVRQNTALAFLMLDKNQLTKLDVSQNTALKQLYCNDNELTNLDVSRNPNLEYLPCNNNQLTSLDVSQNTVLLNLSCENNQLTSLDVSQNVKLSRLRAVDQTVLNDAVSPVKNGSSWTVNMKALLGSSGDPAKVTMTDGSTYNAATGIATYGEKPVEVQYSYDPAGPEKVSSERLTAVWKPVYPESITFVEAFPDANFRAYVTGTVLENSSEPKEGSSLITSAQMNTIANWKEIDVSQKDISDLTGLKYFKALTKLDCTNNQLTSLDISQNMDLTWLSCYRNQLTSLDVSHNTALTVLSCYRNQLTSLDVSQNTALTWLQCNDNQLTNLDVSQNTALENLYCHKNSLKNLNVNQNTALTRLNSGNNQLTSLDVSQNTALNYLRLGDNELTNLDVSRNTALTELYCDNNQLKSLNIRKNTALTGLYCTNNQLTNLDISQNTALTSLHCDHNQLKNLDVGQNTALVSLSCLDNQLASLTISRNVNLTTFLADDQNVVNDTVLPIQKDFKWTVDMKALLGSAGDPTKVTMTDGSAYDAATGIATYEERPVEVQYSYDPAGPEKVSNERLTAIWKPNYAAFPTFTLTFDVDGGDTIPAVSELFGTKINLNRYTPTKAGYIFDGWYSDQNRTWKVVSVTLNTNVTVYANWKNASFVHKDVYSFSNSSGNFVGEDEPDIYLISDTYFNQLVKFTEDSYRLMGLENQSASVRGILQNAREMQWYGSCYGMCATVILNKLGMIDTIQNFDQDAANIWNVTDPVSDHDVRDLINYYQLAQWGEIAPYFVKSMYYTSSWSSNWASTLQQTVQDAQAGKLILINFSCGNFAHCIVGYGCKRNADGGYDIQTYDPNHPGYWDDPTETFLYQGEKLENVTIRISSDYQTCQYIEPTSSARVDSIAPETNFSPLNAVDIDGVNNIDTPAQNVAGANDMIVMLAVAGRHTIQNAEGKELVIDNGRISGSMTVNGTNYIPGETADGQNHAMMSIAVPNSASFTYDSASQDLDVAFASQDGYMALTGSGDGTVTMADNTISVDGAIQDYRVFTTAKDEGLDSVSVSADRAQDLTVTSNGYGVYVSANSGGEHTVTTYYNTADSKEMTYSTQNAVCLTAVPGKDNGTVAVMLDPNSDGVFDTPLDDSSHLPGDINGDGSVNNKDVTRLFQHLSGIESDMVEEALDVNGDGSINNKDVTRLFQYLSGMDVTIY